MITAKQQKLMSRITHWQKELETAMLYRTKPDTFNNNRLGRCLPARYRDVLRRRKRRAYKALRRIRQCEKALTAELV